MTNDENENLTAKLLGIDKGQQLQKDEEQLTQNALRFIKRLEGDCRIKSHILLKINIFKLIFLAFPFALTFVGLIILYQFQIVRLKLIFDQINKKQQATHIFVKGSSITRICKLVKKQWRNRIIWIFNFEELLYKIWRRDVIPLGINISQQINNLINDQYIKSGLSQEQAAGRLVFFGKNEHIVKIPSYYQYIFNAFFLSLFSYMQYFTFIIYLLQNLLFYGILLIGCNFLTTSINYFLIRTSYKQIKDIAEKEHLVSVLRGGTLQKIVNTNLVPGDIYYPEDTIPCDSIVVRKDLFVSEVGFTGQSIPIGKFSINDPSRVYDSQHWAYEGSQIVSVKDNCAAIVINTGYSTRKGRIIRTILYEKPQKNDLFKNLMQQTVIMIVVMVSVYFGFYHFMFDTLQDRSLIFITFGYFIVMSIPSIIPVFMNVSYTIMLLRLKKKGIIGLKREKTIQSSRLQTVCFDKTGTLTENQVQIQNIFLPNSDNQTFSTFEINNIQTNPVIHNLFASCNSIQMLNGRLHGDEIDLKMFEAAKVTQRKDIKDDILCIVEGEGINIQVHKINQFQSKFQSMSAVVKNNKSGEMYVFAKGSPEKLHSISSTKYSNFNNLIKELSLEGYRSIAVSVRRITSEEELNQMINCQRQLCLQGTKLIGIVTFTNKLKAQAPHIIKILQSAEIETKIVTGDNIFVAIQTALALEIIPLGQRVIALEGDKLQQDGSIRAVAIKKINNKIVEEQLFVQDLSTRFEGQILAVDFQFIKKNQLFFLNRNCTIFARATPDLKAIILKKEKERIQNEYNSRSWRSRMFGGRIRKVAMVGDGANDLMAIRQANVGIGISNSDAVYSADFTVTSLNQIDIIIRESKAGEQKLIETILFQFYAIFMNLIIALLSTRDMSTTAFIPSIIKNFGMVYFSTMLISLTAPSDTLTKFCPSFNLISLEYNLIWYGVAIISSGGMGIAYTYYEYSSDYAPNSDRSSLNGNNKTGTINFLTLMIVAIFVYIGFSSSRPFKKPLYTNVPAVILLSFIFTVTTALYFFTQKLHSLQLEPIAKNEALKAYLISLCTGSLCIAYIEIIRSIKFYEHQFPPKTFALKRLKELTHSI